ncbi:MAG: hypothetical protein M1814_003814 [Vezdaea aestivalis]|nr:MAG: hypothetical protein M1814_003814 [Vezdaea aestivalis]
MPEDCQFLTIKQLLRIEEDEERDKMVKNWAVDQKSMLHDGPEALVKMLRKNTGDGQRWQSRTLLRTPVTLFSWAIISYVVGLGVLVFRPLWTVAFGDSGRIAIGALAYAVVTVGIYFGVGISIYGKYLPELEVPDDEVDQRTRKRQKFSTQQPQNIERV